MAGQSVYSSVAEGQVLAGKYRVERVLGEGGMGVVVAARHLQLDERVALKFMQPDALSDSEAVARFAREARAAVKIKSEHVARVTDVGTLENGAPYLVMEYLEGHDLSDWLQKHGPLPVEQAVEFLLQASEAIAEAHALGIVHRDLKPANLFVTRRPDGALSIKVLDFGISKMTGSGSAGPDFGMTKTNAVIGSPHYMSPEQMRSVRNVDARTDIWALGIILYELLSGAAPFVADTLPELVLKIATELPPPIRSVAPHTPPRLEAVIARCLERDLARRFATVGELAVALVEFGPPRSRVSVERISGVLKAAGISQRVAPPRSYDSPTVLDTSSTAASWGQTSNRTSSGRRVVIVAAAVLTVGALGFVGYAVQQRSVAPPPSAGAMAIAPTPSIVHAEPPSTVESAEPPHIAPSPPAPEREEPAPTPPAPAVVAPAPLTARKPLRPAKTAERGAPPAPVVAPKVEAKPPEPVAAPPAPTPPPRPKSTGSVFDER